LVKTCLPTSSRCTMRDVTSSTSAKPLTLKNLKNCSDVWNHTCARCAHSSAIVGGTIWETRPLSKTRTLVEDGFQGLVNPQVWNHTCARCAHSSAIVGGTIWETRPLSKTRTLVEDGFQGLVNPQVWNHTCARCAHSSAIVGGTILETRPLLSKASSMKSTLARRTISTSPGTPRRPSTSTSASPGSTRLSGLA